MKTKRFWVYKANATIMNNKFENVLRWDQVNLLVYGPDLPYFKQKQKKN